MLISVIAVDEIENCLSKASRLKAKELNRFDISIQTACILSYMCGRRSLLLHASSRRNTTDGGERFKLEVLAKPKTTGGAERFTLTFWLIQRQHIGREVYTQGFA
ncbi:hypothetical protein ElyMa_002760600 [Elysia marginata]|uniref:Uncharacterized protein n=1 Tax=Elysia marginata TaxID=1093978 RepID=A0AAV4HIS9_9GAST|nr:hypothetical protein ElyMa_002760600 [Elysia marginata]